MNRRFTFFVAIIGGYFIAAGALQLWHGATSNDPSGFVSILIFSGAWLLGWIGLFGITNLVIRRRNETMAAMESDAPPEADNER